MHSDTQTSVGLIGVTTIATRRPIVYIRIVATSFEILFEK